METGDLKTRVRPGWREALDERVARLPRLSVVTKSTILASIFILIGTAIALNIHGPHSSPSLTPLDLNPQPRWYKGNLHAHTLWSDGNDYPEMISDWYRSRGYHFLALSDHNILSQGDKWISLAEADRRSKKLGFERYRNHFGDSWIETRTLNGDLQVRLKPLSEFRTLLEQPGRFLMIQGEEITDHVVMRPIHMNASNLVELIGPRGGGTVVAVISNNLDAVQEQSKRLGRPILAHVNHPNFGFAINAEELAAVTQERFFEVYNGHPDVHHLGSKIHVGIERMWDIINTLRIGEMKAAPAFGLGTDDSHNYFGQSGSSPGRGWIMVRSRHLTPESIIRAMEAGDFYASSGVTLRSVRYDPKTRTLDLKIEPDDNAHFTTHFIGTLKNYDRTHKPIESTGGQPLPVTHQYSTDVGRVLASVEGLTAVYRLTGEELYVRAMVTSTLGPDNPSYSGQKKQAWTQPVGWEALVSKSDPVPSRSKQVPSLEMKPVQQLQ